MPSLWPYRLFIVCVCVYRREVSGAEDGVFSAVLHLRHDGGQRSAEDGHQHQEPDAAEHHLAELTVTNSLSPGLLLQFIWLRRVCNFDSEEATLSFSVYSVLVFVFFMSFFLKLCQIIKTIITCFQNISIT